MATVWHIRRRAILFARSLARISATRRRRVLFSVAFAAAKRSQVVGEFVIVLGIGVKQEGRDARGQDFMLDKFLHYTLLSSFHISKRVLASKRSARHSTRQPASKPPAHRQECPPRSSRTKPFASPIHQRDAPPQHKIATHSLAANKVPPISVVAANIIERIHARRRAGVCVCA